MSVPWVRSNTLHSDREKEMKNNSKRFLFQAVGLIVLSLVVLSNATAQDKAAATKAEAPKVEIAKAAAWKKGEPTNKELINNDKVRVYESTFQPGDVSPNRARVDRVVHYFTSGTLQRTYPDGKIEDRVFKAGDTIWSEAKTYAVKNNTKSVVRLLIVIPKSK